MKSYEMVDVFTSTHPADELNYIQRPAISKRFDRALEQKGRQIIVYGPSGAGKSSLILNKKIEFNLNYIITQCITTMTFEDIILDAFGQLEIFHKEEVSSNEMLENKASLGLSIPIIGLSAGIGGKDAISTIQKFRNSIDFKPTPQRLIEELGKSKKIWIIEDFHKINDSDKKNIAQLMKMFMDKSTLYPSLKVIAIGAVNTARQVLHYDNEMNNRISEIEVPLMTYEELESIIIRGEKLLNISIVDSVKKKIISLSSGLPSVTHQICYLMCKEERLNKTNPLVTQKFFKDTLDKAIDEYIHDYSDTFKSTLETALKVVRNRKIDNPIEIFKAILHLNKEFFSTQEVLKIIQFKHKEYRGNGLERYLFEFTTPERGEVLRYSEEVEKFYFINPFIKAYFYCSFNHDKSFKSMKAKIKNEEIKSSLFELYKGLSDDIVDYDEEDFFQQDI